MQQYNYTIPDHISGTTFEGVQFTVTVNASPFDISGGSVELVLASVENKRYTMSSVKGDFSITDGVNGVFQMNSQIINIVPGTYYGSIFLTTSSGTKKAYIKVRWTLL